MGRATFSACALTVLLMIAPAAANSQAEAPADTTLATEAQALLDEIAGLRAEYQKLDAQMRSNRGDEGQVAALQAQKRLLEFIRAVNKLVANVQKQKEAGADVAGILQKTRTLLWSLDRRIPQFIDNLRDEIGGLRGSAEDAAPESVASIEGRIDQLEAILDEAVRFSAVHIQNLEALGLRTDKVRAAIGERLRVRADALSGHLELARTRLDDLRTERDGAGEGGGAAVRVAEEDLDRIASSLWTTCDVMDELGLPTVKYRQALITETGEITTDVLKLAVVKGLADDALDASRRWLQVRGPALLGGAIVFVAIVGVFWLLGQIVRRVVARVIGTAGANLSELARRMIVSTASRLVVTIGLFVALSQAGVNVTALLAGLGIAGFIVGFALQDTLGNFASGAMILMYRPFDVGDTIEAAGVLGSVGNMNMVSTTILTFDNQTIVVPNSRIWGDVIRNVTAQDVRRVDLEFPLSHDADVAQVEEMMGSLCREYPTVLPDPPPAVRVHKVTESSVLFIVRPWVKTADYWPTYWDLNREAKIRLTAAGISMGATRHEVRIDSPPRSTGSRGESIES